MAITNAFDVIRHQGRGYVTFTAYTVQSPVIKLAAGAYWPKERSGKLWDAEMVRREREGIEGATRPTAHYGLATESDMEALVVQEATKAITNG